MLDREAVLIIDVPCRDDNGIYINQAGEAPSPLDVLLLRMERVVQRKNIVLLTGRGPQFSVFNRFVATRNLNLFPTKADHRLKRVLTAVAACRIETIIRVSADNTFADPVLIENMAAFHMNRENPAYTFCENAPAWAGGEVISLGPLQRAFDATRLDSPRGEEPGVYFRRNSADYDCQKFSAPSNVKWPARNYSLETPDSTGYVLAALRRVRDPAAVPSAGLPG